MKHSDFRLEDSLALLVPQEAASAGGLDLSATYESSMSRGLHERADTGALSKLSKDQLAGILKHAQQQVSDVEAENRRLREELYRLRAHMENGRCVDSLFRIEHRGRARDLGCSCASICSVLVNMRPHIRACVLQFALLVLPAMLSACLH